MECKTCIYRSFFFLFYFYYVESTGFSSLPWCQHKFRLSPFSFVTWISNLNRLSFLWRDGEADQHVFFLFKISGVQVFSILSLFSCTLCYVNFKLTQPEASILASLCQLRVSFFPLLWLHARGNFSFGMCVCLYTRTYITVYMIPPKKRRMVSPFVSLADPRHWLVA